MDSSDSESNGDEYYTFLNLTKQATLDDIKKKKREMMAKYHPDKLKGEEKEKGSKMLKKLNDICEVLLTPEKKKMYDRFGREGLKLPPGFGDWDYEEKPLYVPEASKLVPNIKTKIRVNLEDLLFDKVVNHTFNRLSLCKKCLGRGAVNIKRQICKECKGVGMRTVIKNEGLKTQTSQRSNCFYCNCTGFIEQGDKCDLCNGDTKMNEQFTMTIHIVPGAFKNNPIEIKNIGHEINKPDQVPTQTRGNVLFFIEDNPHPVFTRYIEYKNKINPADLGITVELTLEEAICGFVKYVKMIDGSEVCIDISEPVNNGEMRIIEKKGLPYKNKLQMKGDVFVTFKVILPQKLTVANKNKIYEALTGKKFNNKKLHTLPENTVPTPMKKLSEYKHPYIYGEHDLLNQPPNDGKENTDTCAQQ